MFQKGQSGNPNGRPRGIHGGRAKALILLDAISGKSKCQRLIGAAIEKNIREDPMGFFKYSNKMRGQRGKQIAQAAQAAGNATAIIDVSEHKPRRIPSPKWRELIKKVWEADPLLCPRCQKEMRIVALIDDRAVIERILHHLGLWQQGIRVSSGPDPPADLVIEPCFDDPLQAYAST